MASKYQIQMDFSQATQKANDLDNIADDLKRLSGTDLQNTLNGLSRDWKGDNATKYINKGFELKEEMEKTVKSLHNTASSIRRIAKNVYDTEMEALRIAEEREAAAKLAQVGATITGRGTSGSGGGGGRAW